MAFGYTFIRKEMIPGGIIKEEGTYSLAAATTGDIYADTSSQPEIVRIDDFAVSNDADTAVVEAQDAGPNILKLTGTSGDTGKYVIYGKAR